MNTKAIVVAFHMYTPWGKEFYQPIYDFFIHNLSTYKDEFDTLYLIDSTWNIENPPKFARVIKVSPHLRYYDAYKEVLPQVKESFVLFMDNDMVVYRKNIIKSTFDKLREWYDVVSIYDTIGDKRFSQLNGQSKFCPYWFATGKDMLMDFRDCDWGSNMPYYETLGKLTETMLREGVKPYEWPEDKNSIYFDGTKDAEKGKDLGYYHCRNGSLAAYLLSTKKYGNIDTYNEYLKNQPRNETLRLCAWYDYMNEKSTEGLWKMSDKGMEFLLLLKDMDVELDEWKSYIEKFKTYHGLEGGNVYA